MSHFLDRLTFFRHKHEPFANGHGVLTEEDRKWENAYRSRWSHDKIARSTHGVNCTGSCSWKIYVKNGIITWETQQPTIRAPAPTCPTTNLAAARAVRRTVGTSIPPSASNIR